MPPESKKADSRAPGINEGVKGGTEGREQRLAAALRENLRKRKAQQRERAVEDGARASGSGDVGGRD